MLNIINLITLHTTTTCLIYSLIVTILKHLLILAVLLAMKIKQYIKYLIGSSSGLFKLWNNAAGGHFIVNMGKYHGERL